MSKPKCGRYLMIAATWLYSGVSILLFVICGTIFYGDLIFQSEKILICALYTIFSILLNHINNSCRVDRYGRFELGISQNLSNVIAVFLCSCVLVMILGRLPNLLPVLALIAVHLVWSIIWCTITSAAYFSINHADKMAAVYDTAVDMHINIQQSGSAKPNVGYLAVKRLGDIIFSLLGMILASPIMLATAIAIKLCDKGPVLYRQTRLTRNGRLFTILKFRSMHMDAERDGVARLASVHDSRITPVGRFIRAYRIDELPQLYNILVGDMTIVGPRPERPELAAIYEKEIPEFALRLQVKAGLTGLAQVYGRYDTDPASKLKMDLMYINKMSVIEDLRLILLTPRILFMKESSAGISVEQPNASNHNTATNDKTSG